MYASANRKKDSPERDHASSKNFFAPSWRQMLTPQNDGGARPIQRRLDGEQAPGKGSGLAYDLDAMLQGSSFASSEARTQARVPLVWKAQKPVSSSVSAIVTTRASKAVVAR